jgi:hypothetical protein
MFKKKQLKKIYRRKQETCQKCHNSQLVKAESNILKIFEDLRAQLHALLNHSDKA